MDSVGQAQAVTNYWCEPYDKQEEGRADHVPLPVITIAGIHRRIKRALTSRTARAWLLKLGWNWKEVKKGVITLAGIACIIMREVYATIGESIYPNPSFLSRDFPEASGRLLRNLKEFTFQDMAN